MLGRWLWDRSERSPRQVVMVPGWSGTQRRKRSRRKEGKVVLSTEHCAALNSQGWSPGEKGNRKEAARVLAQPEEEEARELEDE